MADTNIESELEKLKKDVVSNLKKNAENKESPKLEKTTRELFDEALNSKSFENIKLVISKAQKSGIDDNLKEHIINGLKYFAFDDRYGYFAISAYKLCLDIEPNNPDVLNRLIYKYLNTNKIDEAESLARDCVSNGFLGEHSAKSVLAFVLDKKAETSYNKKEEIYKEIVELDDTPTNRQKLIKILINKGNFSEVEEYFKRDYTGKEVIREMKFLFISHADYNNKKFLNRQLSDYVAGKASGFSGEEEREILKDALSIDSDNNEVKDNLCNIYRNLAQNALDEAQHLNFDDSTVVSKNILLGDKTQGQENMKKHKTLLAEHKKWINLASNLYGGSNSWF